MVADHGAKAAVVVVNWNSGDFLSRCVYSLLRNAEGRQIIVVDNASEDSSLQFLPSLSSNVTLVRNRENVGFAAANNLGWRASKEAFILFLNPDTECFPGSVGRLEQTLIDDKTIWAAGGRLISPSGQTQFGFNVRCFPTLGSVVAEMLLIDEIWKGNPWTRHNPIPVTDNSSVIDVDQPAAACLMTSRAALEAVGGFDETFRPAWFEDVDLCRRIRNLGGRIVYQPDARFLHQGGLSLRHITGEAFLECFHTNQIRYFAKHHGTRMAARVRNVISIGLLIRGALSLVHPLVHNASRADSARTFWKAARHIVGLRGVVK